MENVIVWYNAFMKLHHCLVCLSLAFTFVGARELPAASTCAKPFRPPAVPLVSVDPHFSVWSAADRLTDRDTTHWAGARQPLSIILTADGRKYRLCGREPMDVPPLPQTAVRVLANETRYTFGAGALSVELSFMTAKLPDDLEVFSRPVTYVTATVVGAKDFRLDMNLPHELARDDDRAAMVERTTTVSGIPARCVGRKDQVPFRVKGDSKRADWGSVWQVGPFVEGNEVRYLLAIEHGVTARYFGKSLVDWWQRGGKPFETMLAEAVRDFPRIRASVRAFDAALTARAERIGGAKYARVAELAWRQSFAACIFVAAPNGEPYMFSAENHSGGMIGTTDVFYPQLPHLLLAGPTFVKATLAPVCAYASSTNWPYPYAPHDLGLFPVAEGQFYGMRKGQSVGGGDDDTFRMPVEECGNMLICLSALAHREGNADFAGRWWPTVTQWAQYLEKVGFDPENQLCTDDFAGHLAHNANLSVKTIVALAGYGFMADLRGEKDVAARYRKIAQDMVPRWIAAVKGGRHGAGRLAFDRPDTWSMKYNLVWDRLLGFNLFPPDVAEREMAAYLKLQETYGLPLDSRKAYTKADWLVWVACLRGRTDDLETFVAPLYRFLDTSCDRQPFGDWYEADCGLARGFKARSVVGGVFLPFLAFPSTIAADAKVPARVDKAWAATVTDAGVFDGLNYRVFVPQGIGHGEKVPLVLFLHGAGERGTDNVAQLVHGVPQIIGYSERTGRKAIVVAPQCPAGAQWVDTPWSAPAHTMNPQPSVNMAKVLALVKDMMVRYPIDPNRVYVTGISMGGYGAWDIVQRMPEMFAAALPICGGGDVACAPRLVNLPLRVVHGDADSAVPVKRSRDMVAAVNAAGGRVIYTEVPNAEHDVWSRTYADDTVLDWLFGHVRPSAADKKCSKGKLRD